MDELRQKLIKAQDRLEAIKNEIKDKMKKDRIKKHEFPDGSYFTYWEAKVTENIRFNPKKTKEEPKAAE